MNYPTPTRTPEDYINSGVDPQAAEFIFKLNSGVNDAYTAGLLGENYPYPSANEVEQHFADAGRPSNKEVQDILAFMSDSMVRAYEQGRREWLASVNSILN